MEDSRKQLAIFGLDGGMGQRVLGTKNFPAQDTKGLLPGHILADCFLPAISGL